MSQFYGGAEPAEWTFQYGEQWQGPMTLSQLRYAAGSGMLPPHALVHNVRTGEARAAQYIFGPPNVALMRPIAPPTLPQDRPGDDAVLRMLVPVGRSGWAIVAGYLGLVGWLIFPLGPFALLTAWLGHRAIRADPHAHGMGRVVLGYIGGAIGTALLLFFVFAAVFGS